MLSPRQTCTGEQANTSSKKFVKLLNQPKHHRGIYYGQGEHCALNTTGIHFTTLDKLHTWLYYNKDIGPMYWYSFVSFPPDATITCISANNYKTDKIILDKPHKIPDDWDIMQQIISNPLSFANWLDGMSEDDKNLFLQLCTDHTIDILKIRQSQRDYACVFHMILLTENNPDLAKTTERLWDMILSEKPCLSLILPKYIKATTNNLHDDIHNFASMCNELILTHRFGLIANILADMYLPADMWATLLARNAQAIAYLPMSLMSEEFFSHHNFTTLHKNNTMLPIISRVLNVNTTDTSDILQLLYWRQLAVIRPQVLPYISKYIIQDAVIGQLLSLQKN